MGILSYSDHMRNALCLLSGTYIHWTDFIVEKTHSGWMRYGQRSVAPSEKRGQHLHIGICTSARYVIVLSPYVAITPLWQGGKWAGRRANL